MTVRRFILHKPDKQQVRSTCLAFIADLDFDNEYEVEVRPYSRHRTTDANSAYWAGIITPAAEQLGFESTEELHLVVCCELYGVVERAIGGKLYPMPARTTTRPRLMSKQEFNLHMERAAAFLTAQDVILPTRDNWHG